MADPSPLHKIVHARFREVFGSPDHSLGGDDHWALTPEGRRISINVLVNGTAESPAVWVFDPFSQIDNAHRVLISDESDVHKVIEHIKHRLQRAAAEPTPIAD